MHTKIGVGWQKKLVSIVQVVHEEHIETRMILANNAKMDIIKKSIIPILTHLRKLKNANLVHQVTMPPKL